MKPGMKMLLISGRDGERKDRDMRNEYNMDSKYRDSRGRYESERYAPRNEYMEDNMRMGDDMESRRRRDSQGRYMRSEWEDGMEDNYGNDARMRGYPGRPFPVYEGGRSNMNQIGFDYSGDNVRTDYGMTATHHTGNEMEYRKSSKMGGYSYSEGTPMTKEMAEEWTRSMRNEDGTKGPHWTMEQVKQVMAQKGIKYDLAEFYAILNAMYSDYCAVLKKHGVNNIDFYVDLAAAWLNDSDAVPNKAAMYYECIVKHE